MNQRDCDAVTAISLALEYALMNEGIARHAWIRKAYEITQMIYDEDCHARVQQLISIVQDMDA